MNSLKKLKMKKNRTLITSEKDVEKVRVSLEKKTAKAFEAFAKSKQKVRELANKTYLD